MIKEGELLMQMNMNHYFEKLNFSDGKKINVSQRIDLKFSDTMHWHPFVEILLSLHEDSEVIINFIKYKLQKDDLVIMYPGDLHSLEHVKEDDYILVQFPLDLLMIISEFNSSLPIIQQYRYIPHNCPEADIEHMQQLIREICQLYFSDTVFAEMQMYALLLEFFSIFGAHCQNNKRKDFLTSASSDYKSIKKMAKACLYISQNCAEPLTLDDVSAYVGFSKYHFSRLFKMYTNMTFIDYVNTERIKKAETLISNSKAQMIDIAFDSGFSSVSTFNRAFKKVKGVTPREFKKTLIQEYVIK